jgi:integrase
MVEAARIWSVTSAIRRSEALFLHWDAVDLGTPTVEIRGGLTQVGPDLYFSEPKTARGRRKIDLDAGTVEVLRSHRARQAAERLLVGTGYQDNGWYSLARMGNRGNLTA